MKKISTGDLCRIALFTALIAAGAFIKIPTPLVPITLQLGFVVLAGMLLGPVNGTLSVVLYILIGLSGIHVFSQGGGPAYIFMPTFGYIIGFLPGAWISGKLSQILPVDRQGLKYFFAALAGTAVIYLVGVLWLYLSLGGYGSSGTLTAFLSTALWLPLPGDILCCAVGSVLCVRLKPVLNRTVQRAR